MFYICRPVSIIAFVFRCLKKERFEVADQAEAVEGDESWARERAGTGKRAGQADGSRGRATDRSSHQPTGPECSGTLYNERYTNNIKLARCHRLLSEDDFCFNFNESKS